MKLTLIDRYILRAISIPFFFGVTTVVFLFIMQFVLNHLDRLLGKGISEWIILQLIGLNVPWMIILAIPMGILFSTLMTFGNLAATHEITIAKASGVSLFRMMIPLLFVGVLLSLFLFWFNNSVLPDSNHQAKLLLSDISRTKPKFTLESGQFSSDVEGYTILARKVDSLTNKLNGVTIYDHSNLSKLNVITADSGYIQPTEDYSKLIIRLYSGEIHQSFTASTKNYRKIDFRTYLINLNTSGLGFSRSDPSLSSRGDREMRIKDMQKIVDDVRERQKIYQTNINDLLIQNIDYLVHKKQPKAFRNEMVIDTFAIRNKYPEPVANISKNLTLLQANISADLTQIDELEARERQFVVEIQKKYAMSIACLLFILVGCPLGIITRGGNFGISAAISLAFYIFYWATLIGGEKLADRGYMEPDLSMWLGNIILFSIGVLLTLKVNNESITFLRTNRMIEKIKLKFLSRKSKA